VSSGRRAAPGSACRPGLYDGCGSGGAGTSRSGVVKAIIFAVASRRCAIEFRPPLWYAMVRSGRFIALASTSTVRLSGKLLGLQPLPIKFAVQPGPVGIVTLENRTISPAAQRFIDCAREVCRPLAKGG
jgi:DNA-binding transcriptional LysR family regulator